MTSAVTEKNKSIQTHLSGYEPPQKQGSNLGGLDRLISLTGGGVLAYYGLSRRDTSGWVLAALGGSLALRGITAKSVLYRTVGVSTNGQKVPGIKVERSITINKSPEELFQFWRNFENLPRFMKHLESVQVGGGNRSHWVAKGPAGTRVEWDAEITDEKENEMIAWRSVEKADVKNAGKVVFSPAPASRGTVVHVFVDYSPPGGKAGSLIAKMFGEEPEMQIGDDLRRFKAVMETGEYPTIKGQSSCRGRDK